MSLFRSILVAASGDASQDALLDHAARLARQAGASLRLVGVVETLPWYTRLVVPNADAIQAMLVRDQSAALQESADCLVRSGLAASATVLEGRSHIELIREVLRGSHDLLVKRAEPNGGIPFGPLDMHLLRDCPCPVWLVRPDRNGDPYTRVLATVDPEPPADEADLLHIKTNLDAKDPALDARILQLAQAVATADGASLDVLHAWSAPGESLLRAESMVPRPQVDSYVQDARAQAELALQRLLSQVPEPVTGSRRTVHVLKGDPADLIVQFTASHATDLVVMGTVARTGIPGLLIGNTAEAILQRLNASVLAVKPDGFVSPITLD
jgi:nucleotide-binding universal stress UspA family protein